MGGGAGGRGHRQEGEGEEEEGGSTQTPDRKLCRADRNSDTAAGSMQAWGGGMHTPGEGRKTTHFLGPVQNSLDLQ